MIQIAYNDHTDTVTITIIDQYGIAWEEEIPAEDYFPDWEKIGAVTQGAA